MPDRIVAVRLTYYGDIIWKKKFEVENYGGQGIRILKTSSYYILASANGFVRIDDNGNVIGSTFIPLDQHESIRDMVMISPTKFVAATNINPEPPNTYSKLRVIDTSGNTSISKLFKFSDFVRFKKIQLAGNGDIIFGGDLSTNDTTHTDLYALRSDSILNFPPIGINKISENISTQFILYQNFPNPFNPSTKIKYKIGKNESVSLVIYNLLGERVSTLVNKKQNPGIYQIEWNASNFPSGIYFYQLKTNNFSFSRKMLVLK
jgi:hypothetical protein